MKCGACWYVDGVVKVEALNCIDCLLGGGENSWKSIRITSIYS